MAMLDISVDCRRWFARLWRRFLLLSTGPAGEFIHRSAAGDKTLHQGAGEAVLAEPAGGLTAAIKPADDLTRAIDDLAFGVDA